MRKYESKLRDDHAESSRQAISSAVQMLVETKQISRITIRDICQYAGVSVGTFYLYFKNKEQALLYQYHFSDDQFRKMTFRPEAAPLENLAEVMCHYIHMMDVGRINSTRQLYISHLSYSDPYFFSKDRGLTHQLTTWVEAGQKDGTIRITEDSDDIVISLLRFLRGLLYDLAIRTEYIDLSTWNEKSCSAAVEYLSVFKA